LGYIHKSLRQKGGKGNKARAVLTGSALALDECT